MQIVILGGTGMIGQALKRNLDSKNQISLYGRKIFNSLDQLQQAIVDADVVIQLAGANIAARWSEKYKREIWDSRVETTKLLAQALAKLDTPPRVICASAIGYYPQASQCGRHFSENDIPAGDDFLARLSAEWEKQAQQLVPQEKLLITRFGVVLSPQGGALAKMLPAFKFGFGGPVAGGQQCFSWIDIDDLCNAIQWLLDRPETCGTFNLTAPNPLPQKEFAKILGKILHRPAVMPLPMWQLKLLFGEGAQVLTHSASVYPQRLLWMGFEFQYPDAESSLKHLLA